MDLTYEYNRAQRVMSQGSKEALDDAVALYKTVLSNRDQAARLPITRTLFDRIAQKKPLTAIEHSDFPSFATNSTGHIPPVKCTRYDALVKIFDENTHEVSYSDSRRINFHDQNKLSNPEFTHDNYGIILHNRAVRPSIVDKVVDGLYPITMPYYPDEVYDVFGRTVNFKQDDNCKHPNLVEISFIKTPTGQLVKVDRFWMKENDGEYKEIDEEKFYRYRAFGEIDLNYKWIRKLSEVTEDNEHRTIEFVLAKDIEEVNGELFGIVIGRLVFVEPNTIMSISTLDAFSIDIDVDKPKAREKLCIRTIDKVEPYESVEEFIKTNPIKPQLELKTPKDLILGFIMALNNYCKKKVEETK